jgi:hypothetical protein
LELFGKIVIFFLFLSVATCTAWSQDTVTVSREKQKKYTLEPIRATMYAAALPGLGQIYNRKYWKVPFVYAGFGALGYSVTFNSKNYNTLISAYQDFTDIIPETDSYIEILSTLDPADYDPVLHPDTYNPSTAAWVKTQLINGVDYYRKYRDLSYIGIVAWYLITIIDAHVDASLFDYDISDDLRATLAPVTASFAGLTPGITFAITKTF